MNKPKLKTKGVTFINHFCKDNFLSLVIEIVHDEFFTRAIILINIDNFSYNTFLERGFEVSNRKTILLDSIINLIVEETKSWLTDFAITKPKTKN